MLVTTLFPDEIVEEVEALLQGYSDRAAANKVSKLVAGLVSRLATQEHQIGILKHRIDAQLRENNQTVDNLRNQFLSIARKVNSLVLVNHVFHLMMKNCGLIVSFTRFPYFNIVNLLLIISNFIPQA